MPFRHFWCVSLLIAGVLLAGCGGDPPRSEGPDRTRPPVLDTGEQVDDVTIVGLLESDNRFSTLVAALDSAGLRTTLDSAGTYTLFAPTNAAFENLPEGTVEALLTDERDQLRLILRHHLVPGRVSVQGVKEGRSRRAATALDRDTLAIERQGDRVRVGPARILDADVPAANGIVHVIDRVLPPPSTRE